MGLYAAVVYTIVDETGKKSNMQVKFPHTVDIGVLQTFAWSTAEMIDDLIKGQIVDIGISLAVEFGSANLKSAPLAGSDVEEGAYFGFASADGYNAGFTMPTFDETWVVAGTDILDTSATEVDNFVQRIISGQTVGLVNVSPSTNRGEDLETLTVARESFGGTR